MRRGACPERAQRVERAPVRSLNKERVCGSNIRGVLTLCIEGNLEFGRERIGLDAGALTRRAVRAPTSPGGRGDKKYCCWMR